jgi:citrate lyase subunit beta / citryl-CoA lyase
MGAKAIRSLLFVPGDSEKLIEKALQSEADAVIVDLEDAVAPENKTVARRIACDVLSATARDPAVFVRVNAFDTGLTAQDLAAIMPAHPFGIVLPKCSGAEDIARLGTMLEALEARDGIEPGSTRIMTVATETASATLALGQPDRTVTSRLWGMLWGGEDLSAALGAQTNRNENGDYTFPYQFARSQCLLAANALRAEPVDAVHTDFRDLSGLERETQTGLRDGFTAKAAIHPAQIEVINRVMTPTEDQLDWARQVSSLLADCAVGRLDGRMVDLAHKRIAERLLARAAAIAKAGT